MQQQHKMHERLEKYLSTLHRPSTESVASFIETELEGYIRTYADAAFEGLSKQTDWHYYEELLADVAIKPQLQQVNSQSDELFFQALKLYIAFLRSPKYNPQPTATTPSAPKLPPEAELTEGGKKHVESECSNRNMALRRACIERWGYQCQCCGLDFEQAYGPIGHAYIEVHHLRPISSYDTVHTVDATRELVPLCSNCHSMIHHGPNGVMTLKQLREQYRGSLWPLKQRMDD